jgi:hypothetical protein
LSKRRSWRVVTLVQFSNVRTVVELRERTHGEMTEEVDRAMASSLAQRLILASRVPR